MVRREVIEGPDIDVKQIISRYLDLPRFIDLLPTNELHLEPAGNFEDCLEGTLPESTRQKMREHLKNEGYHQRIEYFEFERKIRTHRSCWTFGPEDNI